MKNLFKVLVPSAAMLVSYTASAEPVRVVVSIENLAPSNGTSQTPHWVGFHDGVRFDIYNGNTAADSLPVPNDPNKSVERLAEDGNAGPISETFKAVIPEGVDGVIPGPNGAIGPGDIATAAFELESTDVNHRYFSYASMVLPSNDFWYANGNPKFMEVFDNAGQFVAKTFIVTRDGILDAGTEINSEAPLETAFFGQQNMNTGADEGGVIRDFDANDPETFFKRPGSGGILDDARFAMGDFLIDGYPLVKISFSVSPVVVENRDFRTRLGGREEVPPFRTPYGGIGRYHLRDNGKVLKFDHLSNLHRGAILAAHLHMGKRGENGPVVATLYNRAANQGKLDLFGRNGTRLMGQLDLTDLSGPLAGKALAALISEIDAGNIYVNVHTRRKPSGEIRGQLGPR